MSVVYLTRQGTTLRRRDGNLAVCRGERVVDRIPMGAVERLVVLGNITVAPSAIGWLLGNGVDTVFLSWHGRYLGRLTAGPGKNVYLRLRQYTRLGDQPFRLAIARRIIAAKVAGQQAVVDNRLRGEPDERLSRGRDMLRELVRRCAEAASADELRGLEGRAGAVYFRCFGEMLRSSEFIFRGRNRRPPRDPVNLLLSLGYTLLLAALEKEVDSSGLDPAVGCFHELEYGRPSLVLDLQEEFRCLAVDTLVLRVCGRRVMRLTDFYFPDQMAEEARDLAEFEELQREAPVILTHEGFRKFIGQFEQRCQERVRVDGEGERRELRGLFRRQVERYVRAVKGEADYEALVWTP